jgi:SHS2 domain-containing protein
MDIETTVKQKLLRGYLSRRATALLEIVETSRVFGKRYTQAVDELEEVEELLRDQHDIAREHARTRTKRAAA